MSRPRRKHFEPEAEFQEGVSISKAVFKGAVLLETVGRET